MEWPKPSEENTCQDQDADEAKFRHVLSGVIRPTSNAVKIDGMIVRQISRVDICGELSDLVKAGEYKDVL